ncbi:MAG: 3'-5' exonuclease, partial [Opitutus sp.]
MTLRERLQKIVLAPDYSPANESELARRLAITKKQGSALDHEVQRLLKSGAFTRTRNGRIARRHGDRETPPSADSRKFFVPTRRGPTMPPPERTLMVASAQLPRQSRQPAREAPAPQAKAGGKPKLSRVSAETRNTHTRQPGVSPAPSGHRPGAKASPVSRAEPSLRPGELIGRIQFRAGGSAFVVRENVAGEAFEPALQVFGEDTGVALPGDRVIAREFAGRKGRRPGEKIGGVVRVLARERDSIVGDLRRGRRGFVVQPD